MKIINPTKISGKILSLFDESNKFVVVISPSYKFSYWKKLTRTLDNARDRNIQFYFFVNAEEFESISAIRKLGYEPYLIENLRAKIYFNEGQAIISSINLSESADSNSLDIALQTETEAEYNEVIYFYEKFITSKAVTEINDGSIYVNESQTNGSHVNGKHVNESKFVFCDPWEDLRNQVQNISGKSCRLYFDKNWIILDGRNRYQVFIDNQKINFLTINCALSEKEFDYLKSNPSVLEEGKMKIKLQESGKSYHNAIWGSLKNVQSNSVYKIIQQEEDLIKTSVSEFINGIEKFKDIVYTVR
ncbi:MAG TPA: hypothetical protein VH396_01260 [Chitinophagaceae bacterium]